MRCSMKVGHVVRIRRRKGQAWRTAAGRNGGKLMSAQCKESCMVRDFLRKKLHVRQGGSVRIGELHERYVRYVFWELPIEAHS